MMFTRGNACGRSPSVLDGRIYGYGEKDYTPDDKGTASLFGRRGYAGGIYLPAGGRGTAWEIPRSHLPSVDKKDAAANRYYRTVCSASWMGILLTQLI